MTASFFITPAIIFAITPLRYAGLYRHEDTGFHYALPPPPRLTAISYLAAIYFHIRYAISHRDVFIRFQPDAATLFTFAIAFAIGRFQLCCFRCAPRCAQALSSPLRCRLRSAATPLKPSQSERRCWRQPLRRWLSCADCRYATLTAIRRFHADTPIFS